MQIQRPAKHMQTSLRGIANKARQDGKWRFRHLYSMLNEDNLKGCFGDLRRGAAPGVDGITVAEYERELDANIADLVERLKGRRYRAKLVRRKNIPKGTGGIRPLGIPALEDKLLQIAVAKILSAIFEADFLESSHGYRPGRGPQAASWELAGKLYGGRFRWVVEADIRGFFGSISHPWMLKMLSRRVDDGAFLGLIRKWLKAGVLEEDGQVVLPTTGTPQGGVVSAVLSNVYLHYVLDLWFDREVKPRCKGQALVMRFADDFVCAFQYQADAERFYRTLPKRLGKFCLEISADKTRLLRFSRHSLESNGAFEFLGFEFRWVTRRTGKPGVQRRTSPKKLRASVAAFTDWIKRSRNQRISVIMGVLTRKLRGYYNYYGVQGNAERLVMFAEQSKRILFKWLNRRSHRRSYTWEGFTALLAQFNVPTPRIMEHRRMRPAPS